jgi:pantothenate kinase
MRQVMDERQEQVMEKLQALKEQQQETYERQQALIADMEKARKYDLMEKQKQAKEREEKKQDLQRQVKAIFSNILKKILDILDINGSTRTITISIGIRKTRCNCT